MKLKSGLAGAATFIAMAAAAGAAFAATDKQPGIALSCSMGLTCASPSGKMHALRESGEFFATPPSMVNHTRAVYKLSGINTVGVDKLVNGLVSTIAEIEAAPIGRVQRLVDEAFNAASRRDVDAILLLAVIAQEGAFGVMDPEADVMGTDPSPTESRTAAYMNQVASRLRAVSLPLDAKAGKKGANKASIEAGVRQASITAYFQTYGRMAPASAKAAAQDVAIYDGQLTAIWLSLEKHLTGNHEAVLAQEPDTMEAYRVKKAAGNLINEARSHRGTAASRPVDYVKPAKTKQNS